MHVTALTADIGWISMAKQQKLDSVLAILGLDGNLEARPGLRLEKYLKLRFITVTRVGSGLGK
jgi:hypothetical protein